MHITQKSSLVHVLQILKGPVNFGSDWVPGHTVAKYSLHGMKDRQKSLTKRVQTIWEFKLQSRKVLISTPKVTGPMKDD